MNRDHLLRVLGHMPRAMADIDYSSGVDRHFNPFTKDDIRHHVYRKQIELRYAEEELAPKRMGEK